MKLRMKRTLACATAVIGITGGVLLASSSPAAATTNTCTIAFLLATGCSTAPLPAHNYGHYVRWEVNTVCAADWKVIDDNTGVTVGHGHVGSDRDGSGTITGLYGSRYHLKVYNSCYATFGRIMNDQ